MKRRIALLLWGLLVLISSAAQEICKLSLLIPFEDRRFMDYNPDDSLPFTRSIVSKEDHRRDGLTLLAVALTAPWAAPMAAAPLLNAAMQMIVAGWAPGRHLCPPTLGYARGRPTAWLPPAPLVPPPPNGV